MRPLYPPVMRRDIEICDWFHLILEPAHLQDSRIVACEIFHLEAQVSQVEGHLEIQRAVFFFFLRSRLRDNIPLGRVNSGVTNWIKLRITYFASIVSIKTKCANIASHSSLKKNSQHFLEFLMIGIP